MALTKEQIAAANKRGAEQQRRGPMAQAASFNAATGRIEILLTSGLALSFAPGQVQGLDHARATDLSNIEISPSGFGIRFPGVDVDLYLPALLDGFLGTRSWIAAQNGKAGGRVSSAAKAGASRANGKLGGRPKKLKEAA